MFIVVILCLFYITTIDAALWGESSIREMRRLRQECLHRDHAIQIAFLFPAASMERDDREARSLDYLARLLSVGTSFCSAYDQMTQHAVNYIQHQITYAYRQGKTLEEIERWDSTLKMFKERREVTQHGCAIVEESMSSEERNNYRGIRSPLNKCISDIQHRSSKGLIMDAFREEEQGF